MKKTLNIGCTQNSRLRETLRQSLRTLTIQGTIFLTQYRFAYDRLTPDLTDAYNPRVTITIITSPHDHHVPVPVPVPVVVVVVVPPAPPTGTTHPTPPSTSSPIAYGMLTECLRNAYGMLTALS